MQHWADLHKIYFIIFLTSFKCKTRSVSCFHSRRAVHSEQCPSQWSCWPFWGPQAQPSFSTAQCVCSHCLPRPYSNLGNIRKVDIRLIWLFELKSISCMLYKKLLFGLSDLSYLWHSQTLGPTGVWQDSAIAAGPTQSFLLRASTLQERLPFMRIWRVLDQLKMHLRGLCLMGRSLLSCAGSDLSVSLYSFVTFLVDLIFYIFNNVVALRKCTWR